MRFLCNVSSKICEVISPRCTDVKSCYLVVCQYFYRYSPPLKISFWAPCMFAIWLLEVRLLFSSKNAWKVRFLCNIFQNLSNQFFVKRWRKKLLFTGLIVLLQICKPPTISLLARCMFEMWSFKVRYIFYNAWKVRFLCNVSSKNCELISPRCGDIEICYVRV